MGDFANTPDRSLLAMNHSLEELEAGRRNGRTGKKDPLKARIIEMRYFGGATAEQSAVALSKPVQTVPANCVSPTPGCGGKSKFAVLT